MSTNSYTYNPVFMKRALELARRGAGFVSPNPMVGAVVVKGDEIIAEGWHHAHGQDHAEVDALKKLNFHAEGCAMYVTLEPCCHFGHTPPCVHAIEKSGITQVFVGIVDPNPLVAGKGLAYLHKKGIGAEAGFMELECCELNEIFIHFITTKRPFVNVKAALSLDGKIATRTGDSGQTTGGISSPESFAWTHRRRHALDAILIGSGTALADDPRLTCRLPEGEESRDPFRFVLDAQGVVSPESRMFALESAKTTIITTERSPEDWRSRIRDAGGEVWVMDADPEGHVPILEMLQKMGELHIASVLVEGGSGIIRSFIDAKAVDRFDFLYAPILIGGRELPLCGGEGVATILDALRLDIRRTRPKGRDWHVTAYPAKD